MYVPGKELKVGDRIRVWWHPGTDLITALHPYAGKLSDMAGSRIADLAINPTGMTIEPEIPFEVVQ